MDKCLACGSGVKRYVFKKILADQLVKDWRLSKEERFKRDNKESLFCPVCGCSARSRAIAEAIIKACVLKGAGDLKTWVNKQHKAFKVAEINYCGQLHQFLKDLPGLVLSQYSEEALRAKVFNFLKGIKRQDITDLSYLDNSFDLVLHSEVLEHVEKPVKALKECRRVLKPGGLCIFTIPVVKRRKTRSRKGLKESYHGSGEKGNLVYWEFGGDFVKDNKFKVIVSYPEYSLEVYMINKKN